MKIVYSAIALLLISATDASDAQEPSSERELRGYTGAQGFGGGRVGGNTYYRSGYAAPAAAATCDSTIGHCQAEICDIVSYSCAVAGPAGPPGPAGQPGAIGKAGVNGKDGYDGAPGAVGPAGLAGAPGEKGATGAPGLQGLPGERGPPGYDGKDGVNGLPGAAGKDGAQGPQGPKGDRGEQGPQGQQGPQGPPGAAAAQLGVTHECISLFSQGDGVAMDSCNNGLAGGAVVTCPRGSEMTSCNGISGDASPLAVSCRIEGNQCVCDGCDLIGSKKSYYPPTLTAQARCCQVTS